MPSLLAKRLIRDTGLRREGKIVWQLVPLDDLSPAQRAESAEIKRRSK